MSLVNLFDCGSQELAMIILSYLNYFDNLNLCEIINLYPSLQYAINPIYYVNKLLESNGFDIAEFKDLLNNNNCLIGGKFIQKALECQVCNSMYIFRLIYDDSNNILKYFDCNNFINQYRIEHVLSIDPHKEASFDIYKSQQTEFCIFLVHLDGFYTYDAYFNENIGDFTKSTGYQNFYVCDGNTLSEYKNNKK